MTAKREADRGAVAVDADGSRPRGGARDSARATYANRRPAERCRARASRPRRPWTVRQTTRCSTCSRTVSTALAVTLSSSPAKNPATSACGSRGYSRGRWSASRLSQRAFLTVGRPADHSTPAAQLITCAGRGAATRDRGSATSQSSPTVPSRVMATGSSSPAAMRTCRETSSTHP